MRISLLERSRFLLALWAAALVLTSCGEETQIGIRPEIHLEADGKTAESLTFGKVPTGLSREEAARQSFLVRSLRPVDLHVSSIRVESRDGISHEAFSVEPSGAFTVAGSSAEEVTVLFQPTEERAYRASLVVSSSDEDRPEVRMVLEGDGIEGTLVLSACLPGEESDRTRCDTTRVEAPTPLQIGELIAGLAQPIRVTVENHGFNELTISKVGFKDEDAAAAAGYTVAESVRGGAVVAPVGNQTFMIHLQTESSYEGAAEAVLVVESNDPQSPVVELPLVATILANLPPRACLIAKEIRRQGEGIIAVEPGPLVVGPTDVITFESAVREGCTGDPEGDEVTVEWSITGPDVFARLEDDFGNPTRRTFQAQMIGDGFEVGITATDSLDVSSSVDEHGVPALVPFSVKPIQDIVVELSWGDAKLVDLDLHMVRSTPPQDYSPGFFSRANDCFGSNPNPSWGPDGPLSSPSHVGDDQGLGSLNETIVFNRPEEGKAYTLLVHFYNDVRDEARRRASSCSTDTSCNQGERCSAGKCMEPVVARARVFVRGEERLSRSFEFGSPCETWEIGKIVWPTSQGAPVAVEESGRSFVTGETGAAQCVAPTIN